MRRSTCIDVPEGGNRIRRASRIGWPMVAVCLCVVSGCRDLVAPPAAPAPPVGVSGPVLLLGTDGNPAGGARIHISNDRFVEQSDDELRWNGSTNSDGYLYPELPAGRYRISVRSATREEPHWELPEINLREEQWTLDPHPWVQHGRLTRPDGFPAEDQEIAFQIVVSDGKFGRYYQTQSFVDVRGEFTIVWPAEGEYQVVLNGPMLRTTLAEGYSLPRPGLLEFGFEAIILEAVLTLGGEALPAGSVTIRTNTADGTTTIEAPTIGSTVSYWAIPGPGTLMIGPGNGMPFMPFSRHHEFREGDAPTIELGEHLVEFLFVTPSGAEVVGCFAELTAPGTGSSNRGSGLAGRWSMHLSSGQYVVFADRSGFIPAEMVISIAQDETVMVVMHPEAAP